jgi:hypothetical protein
MNRFAGIVFALAAAGPMAAQTQQAAVSPITEMMVKARIALDDLKYREADSLARRVLALGSLLSRQQQVEALQLVAAAAYPDEASAQKVDSAIAVIRVLVGLGATSIPREISNPPLDSLFAFVSRAAQPSKVLLGTRASGAVLFVDGQAQGVIYGLRTVLVPPGKQVQLSIRAENCTSWDTMIVTQSADSLRIGFRSPGCKK